MSRVVRPVRVLLAVYLVLLGAALLSQSSHVQHSLVVWVGERLQGMGLEQGSAALREMVMNAILVVPATFLGSAVRRGHTWRDWTAFGFLVALTVEAVQGLMMPGRQPSFADVVANRVGACVGALLARWSLPAFEAASPTG